MSGSVFRSSMLNVWKWLQLFSYQMELKAFPCHFPSCLIHSWYDEQPMKMYIRCTVTIHIHANLSFFSVDDINPFPSYSWTMFGHLINIHYHDPPIVIVIKCLLFSIFIDTPCFTAANCLRNDFTIKAPIDLLQLIRKGTRDISTNQSKTIVAFLQEIIFFH